MERFNSQHPTPFNNSSTDNVIKWHPNFSKDICTFVESDFKPVYCKPQTFDPKKRIIKTKMLKPAAKPQIGQLA
jgi:hypothetical protein